MENPRKVRTGLTRLAAAGYSIDGIVATFRGEAAFRQAPALAVVLVPVGLWLGRNGLERALLAASLLLVLIVELLNSAIEAAVDRQSLELHPLAKRAKDCGSAAVLLSLVLAATTWALVLPM